MPHTPTRHPADTWPPTQLRLDPTAVEDSSLSGLEMPLATYYFTPTHHESYPFGHPAGGVKDTPKKFTLEDPSSALRSRRYEDRRGELRDSSPLVSEPSDSSDEEDYVRFPPGGLELRRCPDETRKTARKGGDRGKKGFSRNPPSASTRDRGRPSKRELADARGPSGTRRKAWREPSPYVRSVDEHDERGGSKGKGAGKKSVSGGRPAAVILQEDPIDEKEVEERLRRRKVRFVLPAKE